MLINHFQNLRISQRLSAGFGLIIFFFILACGFGFNGIGNILENAVIVIEGNKLDGFLAQKEVDHLNWAGKVNALITNENVTTLNVQTDHKKCGMGKWLYGEDRKITENQLPPLAPLILNIEKPHYQLHQSAIEIKKVLSSPDKNKVKQIYTDKTIPSLLSVQSILKTIRDEAKNNIMTDKAMLSSAESTRRKLAVVSILAILAGILLTVLCSRSITNPINGFLESATKMSNGNLLERFAETVKTPCYTIRNCEKRDCPSHNANTNFQKGPCWLVSGSNSPEIHCPRILKGKAGGGIDTCEDCEVFQNTRLDEISELSRGLNTFIVKLQSIVKKIGHNAEELDESSKELSALSGNMLEGSGHMSEKSNSVAVASEEMSSNITTMSAAMEQTTTNINMVATAIEEMTATVNEIASNSDNAREITNETVTHVKTASERVNELGNAAKQISEVTETITEISEQTNLLALNATIEAARAGEAGKGFAVVANEIKELAKQTAEATLNIKKMIDDIQSSALGTVTEIEQISTIINSVKEVVSSTAAAVEEQSVTSNEISENLIQASQGLQKVNENVSQSSVVSSEIAEEINTVNQEANEISNGSSLVDNNAVALSKLASQLNEMTGWFKV